MIKKEEYRVICWQPATSSLDDQIFADIVPANGVIHDMIFYTRLKLMRGNESAMTIRDIAKSIYLNVIGNNEPEITFAQSTIVSKEQLRSVILKTYYQMKSAGKNSTLDYILSAPECENYAEYIKHQEYEQFKQQQQKIGYKIPKSDEEIFMQRERQKRQTFKQKHFPQTPQEERFQQNREEFYQRVERRIVAQQTQAMFDAKKDPITRLKERYQRDGD